MHWSFTNNITAHTFIFFAGRYHLVQQRSLYPANGLEGQLRGRRSSELPQSEAAPLMDMCQLVVGLAQKPLYISKDHNDPMTIVS
jgi:hypothetical protein